MSGFRPVRGAFLVVAALAALAVPAIAAGDRGSGGGGGGGGTPPPPTTAPAVAFTPTALTFPAQAIGTTSAPQSITVTNTGSAGLFINSAAVPNTLDFTEVSDGCSGLTLAAGTSCSVSITFSPTLSGTRSAAFTLTDNAANSPQTVPLTGGGTGTNPSLAIDSRFFACANSVCEVGAGHNVFVNNFFTTTFSATGGTPPYRWSGQVPAGLTLRSSGLLFGAPSGKGTFTFVVTVADAAGTTATGNFSLTVTDPPAPSPSGCQTGGVLKEELSGSSFNGKTPSGQASADETRFSGCGGFSLLSVQVKDVNLPDASLLWVTLDFMPVGTISLRGGSGTMATYNMGFFGVSNDDVRVYSALPDISNSQQILIGGAFR